MAAKTPVVKTANINGMEIKIHACPWTLYRKIYGTENGTAETLALIEEVVRECAEPVGDNADVDVIETLSGSQINRIFELSVDQEGVKPDF